MHDVEFQEAARQASYVPLLSGTPGAWKIEDMSLNPKKGSSEGISRALNTERKELPPGFVKVNKTSQRDSCPNYGRQQTCEA